ncbi:hypothetical protein GCM10028818_31030 [Spirosoma horti]
MERRRGEPVPVRVGNNRTNEAATGLTRSGHKDAARAKYLDAEAMQTSDLASLPL